MSYLLSAQASAQLLSLIVLGAIAVAGLTWVGFGVAEIFGA